MDMSREVLQDRASNLKGVSCCFPDGSASLPLIVSANHGQDINAIDDEVREFVINMVGSVGAVLLRGFKVASPLALRKFAASFGLPLASSYEYGSTPRSRVSSGVYNSTEYPAHSSIPMHNEQSYTTQWPSYLWFHCMKASQSGGETPLVDSRVVFNEIPERIRNNFMSRGLMYVRHFSPVLDVPWQQVFNTESRQDVEAFCRAQNIDWEWLGDDSLKTRQLCQSVLQHPITKEWVWFNQAHLFHVSVLEAEAREGLVAALGEENLPRNVYYGDGSAIADSDLDIIRAVFERHKSVLPWQKGDITMVDNLLAAHGRNPYEGERRVIVAMA